MTRSGDDLDSFGSTVAIIQSLTAIRGYDFVGAGKNHHDCAAIVLQQLRRIEAVAQEEPHRQQRHFFLGDRDKVVVRRKQHHAGYLLPVVSLIMSLGSLVAAGVLTFLKFEKDRTVAERAERVIAATRIPATRGAQ